MLQLVQSSCDRNSGDRFKKVSYGAPESGWPSSDSSWQCYYMLGTSLVPTPFRKGCGHETSLEPLVNCQCGFTFLKENILLRLKCNCN